MKTKIVALSFILILGAAIFYLYKQPTSSNVDILITNARVVTMDSSLNIYTSGWVAIKGNKIVNLGQGQPQGYFAVKTIDAQGKVVMPGLINTHSHAGMAVLDGALKNQKLELWLLEAQKYESQFTDEDVYWSSLLAESKMITSGTTTFNDMYPLSLATQKAATQAGMRAIMRIGTGEKEGESLSFNKPDNNSPLITFSLAPNPLINFTPSQLKQISDYALANNYLVHVHFDEDEQSRMDSLEKFNKTPFQLIEDAGLLRNKIVLAHGGDLNDEEINKLGEKAGAGVGVSFNPLCEKNLQDPLTPVTKLVNKKITVALGTDGAPCSDLDMFSQIRLAAVESGLNAIDIIKMSTVSAAKALGLENQIGSLEPGKLADLIMVDQKSEDDIYRSLVYNTRGKQVTDSIINGKQVLSSGKLLTINEPEVMQETSKITSRLKAIK